MKYPNVLLALLTGCIVCIGLLVWERCSLTGIEPVDAASQSEVLRTDTLHRTAYLVVENRVVLNGTEVILEYSDQSVKIQLLSGNSELNFLIGGDRRVRELDLGAAEIVFQGWSPGAVPDSQRFLMDNIDKPYPLNDWLVLSFYDRETETIGNRYLQFTGINHSGDNLSYAYDNPFGHTMESGRSEIYVNHRPQPYLCFIIRRILEAVGYNLQRNFLANHSQLRYLYLVHGYDTLEFARMLPDWTVNELMTQLEKLFDCSFIVNEDQRSVDLLLNYERPTYSDTEYMEVEDEFFTEVDNENLTTQGVSNVGYELTNDIYHRYQSLDPDVLSRAVPTDVETLADLQLALSNTADTAPGMNGSSLIDMRTRRLWYVRQENTYFIARQQETGSGFYAYRSRTGRTLCSIGIMWRNTGTVRDCCARMN